MDILQTYPILGQFTPLSLPLPFSPFLSLHVIQILEYLLERREAKSPKSRQHTDVQCNVQFHPWSNIGPNLKWKQYTPRYKIGKIGRNPLVENKRNGAQEIRVTYLLNPRKQDFN